MDMITAGKWKGSLGLGLAPRELEATLYAAAEMTAKEIARAMGISPATANKRLESARFKLGVRSVRGLVMEAFKRGIIAPACVAFLAVVLVGQHHQATAIRRPDAPRRIEMRVTARRDACVWVA